MKKRLSTIMAIAAALSMLFIAGQVMAGDNDGQVINYSVTAINEIAITADTITLTVNTATAGAAPDQATDSGLYAITTNCDTDEKKITASLDGAAVDGLTFGIHLVAPAGGANVAAAELVAGTPRDVVTDIDGVNEIDLAISYTLDATVGAGVIGAVTKTVTLTIADTV